MELEAFHYTKGLVTYCVTNVLCVTNGLLVKMSRLIVNLFVITQNVCEYKFYGSVSFNMNLHPDLPSRSVEHLVTFPRFLYGRSMSVLFTEFPHDTDDEITNSIYSEEFRAKVMDIITDMLNNGW